MVIPHKLSHNARSAVIDNDGLVQHELDVLQLMEDSFEVGTATYDDTTSQKYIELGAKITLLDSSDSEAQRIKTFITGTVGDFHRQFADRTSVKNVYALEIPSERSRYDKCDVDNEMELFHGSRNCNILGICRTGLKIAPPEAPVSGWAFGKGNYFADKSSKSLQYSLKSFGSMTHQTDNCFLFISKVRLGKQMVMKSGFTGEDIAAKCLRTGHHSTLGDATKGYLRYNEFITYTLEQNTLTHIVELSRPRGYTY